MNSLVDLHQALADEAARQAPPGGLESRVLTAALSQIAGATDTPRKGRRDSSARAGVRFESSVQSPRAMALVAVLLAVAIMLGLLLTTRALRAPHPVPGVTPPVTRVNFPLATPGVAIRAIRDAWFYSPLDGAVALYYPPGSWQGANHGVLITHDGGKTWLPVPLDYPEINLRWMDEQHLGAVLGNVGPPVAHASSSDGGYQWQFTKPNDFGWQPVATFFLDANEGWALCTLWATCGNVDPRTGRAAEGIVYHTVDSGADWQQIGVASGVVPLGIMFTDSQHGFLSTASADGIGRLFASEDGGRSWRPIQLPAPPGGWPGPAGGAGCDTATCVTVPTMFGRQGMVIVEPRGAGFFTYTTSDGGRTWGNPRPLPVQRFQGVYEPWRGAQDGSHWWMADGAGALYVTADAGRSWQQLPVTLPGGYTLRDVTPVGGNVLWGTATNQATGEFLVRSTDGGATWALVKLPSS